MPDPTTTNVLVDAAADFDVITATHVLEDALGSKSLPKDEAAALIQCAIDNLIWAKQKVQRHA